MRRAHLSTVRARRALVVGAGPRGIAAAGVFARSGYAVSWIDPSFDGGALSQYSTVPANTKVDLLQEQLQFFMPAVGFGARRAIQRMRDDARQLLINPDPAKVGWVGLDLLCEYMRACTAELRAHGTVRSHGGVCTALRHDAEAGRWHAETTADEPVDDADVAVVAVGGAETPVPAALQPDAWAGAATRPPPRRIPLGDALQLEKLRGLVGEGDTVGVVGGGHSGFVICHYLLERLKVRKVRLFVRKPIALAEWSAELGAYDAWAFRGLKGLAADLAIRLRVAGRVPPNGVTGGAGGDAFELHHSSQLAECADTAAVDAVIYCLGYRPAPVPPLVAADGRALELAGHAEGSGELLVRPVGSDAPPAAAPGLYGAGLAFADLEYTSGGPYEAAGMPMFAERAWRIAEAEASRVREA